MAAPAYAHSDLLRGVAPFVEEGAAVGSLFAQVIRLDSTRPATSAGDEKSVVDAARWGRA